MVDFHLRVAKGLAAVKALMVVCLVDGPPSRAVDPRRARRTYLRVSHGNRCSRRREVVAKL
jgi:hypothetical protein